MLFKPLSMSRTLERTASDEPVTRTGETISLQLTPADRDVLEVNDRYVVCHERHHRIYYEKGDKIRELIEAHLTVRPDFEWQEHLGDAEKADPSFKQIVGTLCFLPEQTGSDYHRRASVYFDIGIDRATYEALERQLEARVLPEDIWIDLVSPLRIPKNAERSFEYGWEPDGSRMVWRTREQDYDTLPVKGIRFSTSVVRNDLGDLDEADDAERVDQAQALSALFQLAKQNQTAIADLSRVVGKAVWLLGAIATLILFALLR